MFNPCLWIEIFFCKRAYAKSKNIDKIEVTKIKITNTTSFFVIGVILYKKAKHTIIISSIGQLNIVKQFMQKMDVQSEIFIHLRFLYLSTIAIVDRI